MTQMEYDNMHPEKQIQEILGFCPLCESLTTFIKGQGDNSEIVCTFCGSLPAQRAVYHIIKALFSNWFEMKIFESEKYYTSLQFDIETGSIYDIIIYDPTLDKTLRKKEAISSFINILKPRGYLLIVADTEDQSENEIVKEIANQCSKFEIEVYRGENRDLGVPHTIFIVVVHMFTCSRYNQRPIKILPDFINNFKIFQRLKD